MRNFICKPECTGIGVGRPYLTAKDSLVPSTLGTGNSRTKTMMISSKTWRMGATGVIPCITTYEKGSTGCWGFFIGDDI